MKKVLKILLGIMICLLAVAKLFDIVGGNLAVVVGKGSVEDDLVVSAGQVADTFIEGIPYGDINNLPYIVENHNILEGQLQCFANMNYLRPEYIMQYDIILKDADISAVTGKTYNTIRFYYEANIPKEYQEYVDEPAGLDFFLTLSNENNAHQYEIVEVRADGYYDPNKVLPEYDPTNKKIKIFGTNSIYQPTFEEEYQEEYNEESEIDDEWSEELPDVEYRPEYFSDTKGVRFAIGDDTYTLDFNSSKWYFLDGEDYVLHTGYLNFTNNSDRPVVPADIFIMTAEQDGSVVEWMGYLDINSADRGPLDFAPSYEAFHYEDVPPGRSKEYLIAWNALNSDNKLRLFVESNNGKMNRLHAGDLHSNKTKEDIKYGAMD